MSFLVTAAAALAGPALARKFMFHPKAGGERAFDDPIVSMFVPTVDADDVATCSSFTSARCGEAMLHVLLVPVASSTARPILLHSHGNAGNVTGRAPSLLALAQALDVTLVAYDYRGFGLSSPGPPTETSILEDGDAVLACVRTLFPRRPIVVWGESMGGAVAAHLAKQPAVTSVVMHITFGKLADMVPFELRPALSALHDTLDSAARIAAAGKPTAVIRAQDDELMTEATTRSLYEAAPAGRRIWLSVPGGHNTYDLAPALPQLKAFLDATL